MTTMVRRVPPSSRCRPLLGLGTPRRMLWVWVIAGYCGWTTTSRYSHGFGLVASRSNHHHHHRIDRSSLRAAGSLDYEYIVPPEDDSVRRRDPHGAWWSLPSSFPDDTPAGLRGEAIRSALRSRSSCVGWNFGAASGGGGGVVQIQGPGTRDFLNHKLTQSFPPATATANPVEHDANHNNYDYHYTEACLLTPKGRVVDRIGVAWNFHHQPEAYLIPSRGHTARALFDRLNPFVFPLDQVQLTCRTDEEDGAEQHQECRSFSLASVDRHNIQRCWDQWMRGPHSTVGRAVFPSAPDNMPQQLPEPHQCWRIPLPHDDASCLLVVPSSGLPAHAGAGYTFFFLGTTAAPWGDQIWNGLCQTEESHVVVAGPREFESLRIEAGQPAFGYEMTGALDKDHTDLPTTTITTPASPLELHLMDTTVRLDKGCYLGQEGVASQYKNPRGPPRTLYHVVFPDDGNLYPSRGREPPQSTDRRSDYDVDNATRVPVRGDALYALGSNEQIAVGALTSVAEPSSTGEPAVRALALVRRADSIANQMRSMGLEFLPPEPSTTTTTGDLFDNDTNPDTGILLPPPLKDPLDGLEVIVGGTFTVGRLETVPIRRRRQSNNNHSMFDDVVPEFVQNLPGEDAQNDILDVSSRTVQEPSSVGTEQAAAKAEYEAAEGQRKAEKMALLQKRAAEALARRKQKNSE